MPKICNACKTKYDDDNIRFCSKCGFEFKAIFEKYDAFISYRRDGGSDLAELIKEKIENLTEKRMKIFLDVEELGQGIFNAKLLKHIENSDNFILVLSPGALDRCMNEGDWVRTEIAHAIKNHKYIIPISNGVFNFNIDLPDDIKELKDYNAIVYNHTDSTSSIRKLLSFMKSSDSIKTNEPEQTTKEIPLPHDEKQETAPWPEAGIAFLKNIKNKVDPTVLPFKPVEISPDEDIEGPEPEIDWCVDDTYYFAVWFTNKRLDKIDLRWGYYSRHEKRDPLFRKTSDAFCQNKAWMNDDGNVLIDGDIYSFDLGEGYLGFETSQRKTISSLSDPVLVEIVAKKMTIFSQSVWPIIVENREK
ncbi:TIR domain-containing protein [bacterium]|nr:MAG: TIR domain-containing protein [bacterium]